MKPTRTGPHPSGQSASTMARVPLEWMFPAMLVMPAAEVLWTQRDLAQSFEHLQALSAPARPLALMVLQRTVSLVILAVSVGQILQHLARPSAVSHPATTVLVTAFLGYWVGTIGLPAVFGAHPGLTHELMYPLLAGIAVCLVTPGESDRILRTARDALLVLMAAGLLLALARPAMVFDMNYSEGLLPGLPRFAGLTPHPVAQGMLAQLALLLLAARPLPRVWLHRSAWMLAWSVLLLAQSKTAWIAWIACAVCLRAWRPASAPRPQGEGRLAWVCVIVIAGALVAMALGLTGGASSGGGLSLWSDTGGTRGAQLATLTGRDRIWAAAAQEWREHPVFGYGLSLWDPAYRLGIGLPQATHAHNQLMDDAARAGSVGVASLVVYLALLATLAGRRVRPSAGLTLALFLALVIRGVSEVPLVLLGYGSDLFTHLLLLVAIAGTVPAATHARWTQPPSHHPARRAGRGAAA